MEAERAEEIQISIPKNVKTNRIFCHSGHQDSIARTKEEKRSILFE